MKTLFAIFILASSSVFGQTIRGKVVDAVKGDTIAFANVTLLDSTRESILATQNADENGNFIFEKLALKIYCLKVSIIGYKDTTFSNVKPDNSNELLKFNIHRPCQYDRSLNNNTCPVCLKTDSVLKIEYGLLITEKKTNRKSKKVVIADREPWKDFYPGGCVITNCDPNWYCKRDGTKF